MSIVVDVLAKLANDNSGSLKFVHENVKNWHGVVLMLTGTKNRLDVKLRNGKSYNLSVGEEYVIAEYGGRKLKLCYDTKTERINAILTIINEFMLEGHIDLNVRGRDVVDVGAYNGDTAIYFAFKGARHVYAFEPYPYSYRLARRNVMANSLGSKITMINAGCGSRRGSIKIKAEYIKGLAGSAMKATDSGKKIPIVPLSYVVDKYKLKNAALKVDCEGCEYDIILKSSDETLRRFSKILIEYHYGYARLEKRLKEAGFKLREVEEEHIMKNANVDDQEMHGGTLVAELKR